jgi:hypothetical protein
MIINICDYWVAKAADTEVGELNPIDLVYSIIKNTARDITYLLYRITGNYKIVTGSDSKIINDIVQLILGYGIKLERGFIPGGGIGEIIGTAVPIIIGLGIGEAIVTIKHPLNMHWRMRDLMKGEYPFWRSPLVREYRLYRSLEDIAMPTHLSISLGYGSLFTRLSKLGAALGYKFGIAIGQDIPTSATKLKILSNYLYELTDSNINDNVNDVIKKFFNVIKRDFETIPETNSSLEYISEIFDIVLRSSQYDKLKKSFIIAGTLMLDPIIHKIATTPKSLFAISAASIRKHFTIDQQLGFADSDIFKRHLLQMESERQKNELEDNSIAIWFVT